MANQGSFVDECAASHRNGACTPSRVLCNETATIGRSLSRGTSGQIFGHSRTSFTFSHPLRLGCRGCGAFRVQCRETTMMRRHLDRHVCQVRYVGGGWRTYRSSCTRTIRADPGHPNGRLVWTWRLALLKAYARMTCQSLENAHVPAHCLTCSMLLVRSSCNSAHLATC